MNIIQTIDWENIFSVSLQVFAILLIYTIEMPFRNQQYEAKTSILKPNKIHSETDL